MLPSNEKQINTINILINAFANPKCWCSISSSDIIISFYKLTKI